MTELLRKTVAAALFVLLAAAASFAQGQQGGGQFGQFREAHKYTFQLTGMVRHIGEIDKDKKHSLSADQAKQVLAVLRPLRTKPELTQDQAKQALKELKKVFTVGQLNAMARIKPQQRFGQRRMGEGQPGGGQRREPRPGGDPPGGPRMDADAMKDFNPFYAKASLGDEFARERAKRWNEFFTGLENKAKTARQTRPNTGKATDSSAKKASDPSSAKTSSRK